MQVDFDKEREEWQRTQEENDYEDEEEYEEEEEEEDEEEKKEKKRKREKKRREETSGESEEETLTTPKRSGDKAQPRKGNAEGCPGAAGFLGCSPFLPLRDFPFFCILFGEQNAARRAPTLSEDRECRSIAPLVAGGILQRLCGPDCFRSQTEFFHMAIG